MKPLSVPMKFQKDTNEVEKGDIENHTYFRLESRYYDFTLSQFFDSNKVYAIRTSPYPKSKHNHEWRVENWGTKWNAYQQSRTSANEFSFQTAWSHPSPIIDLLSKMFRSIVFRVKYADEDKGHNLGHYTIQSGVVTYRDDFEAGSQAAQRFSCDVWGYEYEQWLADHS